MKIKYLFLGALSFSSCFVVSNLLGGGDCQPACTEEGHVLRCDAQGNYEFLACAIDDNEACQPGPFTCGICGDGELSTGETCDDGNTADGDGCSSVCQLEGECGNGSIEIGEECDDGNRTNGDTCENDCTLPVCGNGILDQGEECDDGNIDSGDNCSEECQFEFADCGNGIPEVGEACDDGNNINADGCEADCSLPVCGNFIQDSNIGETCDDGNTVSNDGCSSNCREEICGDGVVQSGEACDDGNNINNDACDNTCQVSVGCGNTIVDVGETCDDGNTADGDGCSAACLSEVCGDGVLQAGEQCDDGLANSNIFAGACRTNCTNARCGDGTVDFGEACDSADCTNCQATTAAEVENNDNSQEADSKAAQFDALEFNDATRISGVRGTGDDVFRIELAQPTITRIEIFDGTGNDCILSGDPLLRLFNANFQEIAVNGDEGIEKCSAIVTEIPAGVSYIRIEKSNLNNNNFNYVLEFMPLSSMGNEVENNDDLSIADPMIGPNVFITGDHSNPFDIDTYRIEVPQTGLDVRAQIFESGDGELCRNNEIDSEIFLLDSQGTVISSNDDIAPNNFCSIIDGTGTNQQNSGAKNLPAGTYFIQVLASDLAGANGEVFDYRLAVTIR
jgi:cysteine-rich repeat protein